EMTLDSIEHLINRFVSVFLLPLVNLMVISTIVYFVSSGHGVTGGGYEGFHNYIIDLVNGLIKGDFKPMLDTLEKHQKEIKGASTFLLTTTVIFVVVSTYLLDRIVFYIGCLIPPAFEFDLDTYGRSGANHVERAMRIAGESSNFVTTYGAIRAYLGHKNTDPN